MSKAELEVTIAEAESGEDLCLHLAVLDSGDAVDLLSGLLFGFALQVGVHAAFELHLLPCGLNEDLSGLSDWLHHFLDVPIHLCVHLVHLVVLFALFVVLQVVNLGFVELLKFHLCVGAGLFGHVGDGVLEIFVLLDVGFDVIFVVLGFEGVEELLLVFLPMVCVVDATSLSPNHGVEHHHIFPLHDASDRDHKVSVLLELFLHG